MVTVPSARDANGQPVPVVAMVQISLGAVQLANNISLNAGASSPSVTGVPGATWIYGYGFTGAGLQLEALGPDGSTWNPVGGVVNASGSTGVVIGDNATLRLRNTSGAAITGLFASLS